LGERLKLGEGHEERVTGLGEMALRLFPRLTKAFENPLIVVGGITLFGAMLRFYHLGFKPLWYDEAVLYWISNSGGVEQVISQNAALNSAPPLFAILLHLILNVGDSELVLRFIPWLGGVAVIPATYFLSRQFLKRIPAYFTTAVAAIAFTQVRYSQELREYSLTFLTAAIILALFYRELHRPTWSSWILMTIAMVVGILLQYGLAMLVIALNLVFAIELFSAQGARGSRIFRWGTAQILVFGAVVAVYFLSLQQQMVIGFGATPTMNYLSGAYWNGSLLSLLQLGVLNTLAVFAFTFPDPFLLCIVAVGFVVILRDTSRRTVLELFALPFILTFVAASARLYPYLGDRQDMFLTPMIYVLAGFGFDYLAKVVQRRRVVPMLLAAVFLVGFGSSVGYESYGGTEDIRPIASTLAASFETGDRIYVYYSAKYAFTYYYRKNADSTMLGTRSRENPNIYYQEIDNLLSSNGRLWIVFSHCFGDECGLITQHVSENRKIESVASSNGPQLYLVR
jgi:uncharacterized membrane protein